MTALFMASSVLLVISIFFGVEIPLGGFLFFMWLALAVIKYQQAEKDLKQAGVKTVCVGIIVGFWLVFAGICMVYDGPLLSGVIVLLASCFMIFPVRDEKDGIAGKRTAIYGERIYINAFYAVCIPVGIMMLLSMLKSLDHNKQ